MSGEYYEDLPPLGEIFPAKGIETSAAVSTDLSDAVAQACEQGTPQDPRVLIRTIDVHCFRRREKGQESLLVVELAALRDFVKLFFQTEPHIITMITEHLDRIEGQQYAMMESFAQTVVDHAMAQHLPAQPARPSLHPETAPELPRNGIIEGLTHLLADKKSAHELVTFLNDYTERMISEGGILTLFKELSALPDWIRAHVSHEESFRGLTTATYDILIKIDAILKNKSSGT